MTMNILTNVSWLDYLLIIALLLAIYYIWIGIKFYADEIREIFNAPARRQSKAFTTPQWNNSVPVGTTSENEFEAPEGFENTQDETFEMVERLIVTLKKVVEDSAEQQLDPAAFAQRLSKIFEFYGDLKNSQFQFAIHQLIISECEKLDFNPPSEDELAGLW